MLKRKNPRHIPDKPRYFKLDINGEEWDFRLPFPIHSAKVMQLFPKTSKDENVDFDGVIDIWKVCGALVGVCWANKDYDLESDLETFERNYLRFGEAVLEELYDYDWDMSDFNKVLPLLVKKVSLSWLSDKEINDRANFSEVAKDKLN